MNTHIINESIKYFEYSFTNIGKPRLLIFAQFNIILWVQVTCKFRGDFHQIAECINELVQQVYIIDNK